MACGHRVNAVTIEIRKLDGVTGVEIDLDTGRVTVVSAGTLDGNAARAAVDESWYELAG